MTHHGRSYTSQGRHIAECLTPDCAWLTVHDTASDAALAVARHVLDTLPPLPEATG